MTDNPTWTIREAGAGDASALALIGAATFLETFAGILDGEAITQELLAGGDPETALRRYAERRLPATARIVESNRRRGIDTMLDIVEQRAPQGFTDLESVLPSDELERIVGDYKKLVAQDRETLLQMASQSAVSPT